MANKKLTFRKKNSKVNMKQKVRKSLKMKKGGYVYGGNKRKSSQRKTKRGKFIYGGSNCDANKKVVGGSGCGCNKITRGGNLGIHHYYPYNSSGGMNPPLPGGNDGVVKGGSVFSPHDNSPVSTFGTTLGAPAIYNLINGTPNPNSDVNNLDVKPENTMV